MAAIFEKLYMSISIHKCIDRSNPLKNWQRYDVLKIFVIPGGNTPPTKYSWGQCLSQDLDFPQKRSYLIFLGSYLQKRGVIHSQRKLRDKARKLRERVRSLYITCPEYKNSSIINWVIILLHAK